MAASDVGCAHQNVDWYRPTSSKIDMGLGAARRKEAIALQAEPFENDGGVLSSLMKTLKRAMAAEYSLELSANRRRRWQIATTKVPR